jgi:hypothetical protein
VEFDVLQAQPDKRHLLLLAKSKVGREVHKDRFLCGHDEREWFVAAVPGSASTVRQAMEALKPAPVRERQARKGLNARQSNTRRNAAFVRQGEWFFVPAESSLSIDPKLILRWEPIRRSNGSKAHMVEEVYRFGGEVVYVCPRYPRGISQSTYESVLRDHSQARAWGWRIMSRNPEVYARGAVRHPDHATIHLQGWHCVLMNTENSAPSMAHVAFLD